MMSESGGEGATGEPGIASPEREMRRDPGVGILIALTDDDRAPATIEVAQSLTDRKGGRPGVVYVIEVSASVPEAAMVSVALEDSLRDPGRRAAQEAEMRALLHLDDDGKAAWPFSIKVGNVASVVVQEARIREAGLIVMGLNRHAALGRAIGRDTVRQVMSHSDVPVLAVSDTLHGLPKRIVVAIDFSRASIRAARLARRIVDDSGEMVLLFIEPLLLAGNTESSEGLQLIRDRGVAAAFDELIADLNSDESIPISTKVLKDGKPSARIVSFCEDFDPDLIAMGSQRHRFLDRLLLGSTARAVAADGRWSVLVTPPARAL